MFSFFSERFDVIDLESSNIGEFLLRNVKGKIDEINLHLQSLNDSQFITATAYLIEQFYEAKEFLNDSMNKEVIAPITLCKNSIYVSHLYGGITSP